MFKICLDALERERGYRSKMQTIQQGKPSVLSAQLEAWGSDQELES